MSASPCTPGKQSDARTGASLIARFTVVESCASVWVTAEVDRLDGAFCSYFWERWVATSQCSLVICKQKKLLSQWRCTWRVEAFKGWSSSELHVDQLTLLYAIRPTALS